MSVTMLQNAKFNASAETREKILETLSPTWMKDKKVPTELSSTQNRRRRAGVYMRFSTDNQDPYSFSRQKKVVEEYASRIDVDVVEIFGDPATSGAYTANRPAYKAMIEAARQEKFDLLIVEDGDRLARRLHITTETFSKLADSNVELHSARLGKWSLMHAAFVGMMSEEQRARIYELLRSGIIKILNRGLWPGVAPIGFEKIPTEPGNMRISLKYAASVCRIFELRIAGLGYYQIADQLEREGAPTPYGKWLGSTVRHILFNPLYLGVLIFFRTSHKTKQKDDNTIETTKRTRPAVEWQYAERKDWEIITPEVWRQAHAMDTEAPNVGPRSIYLLSKKVCCAACGKRMHIGGGRQQHSMLRCSTDNKIKISRLRLQACKAPAVRLLPMEDELIRFVCGKLNHPTAEKAMQDGYEAKVAKEAKVSNLERARLQKEKAKFHKRLDATYDQAFNQGHTNSVLAEQRAGYCARIDAIDEKLASIPAVTVSKTPLFATPVDASSFLEQLVPGRNYRGCGAELAQTVATFQRLVDRISIRTNETGEVHIEITGPIAHVGNSGSSSVSLSYTPVTTCNNKIRSANLKSSRGAYDIPDSDWARIANKLPDDPIWIPAFDDPIPIKRVIEAVIASKQSRVGIANLKDSFGPVRQVWAAARILNYYGILDIAERHLTKNDVEVARGITLSLDSTRCMKKEATERHLTCNERRRQQVIQRLASVGLSARAA